MMRGEGSRQLQYNVLLLVLDITKRFTNTLELVLTQFGSFVDSTFVCQKFLPRIQNLKL